MEYPKIETLFVRDETTHKVNPAQLRNRAYGLINSWSWTEKIDGTNIRCQWDHATKIVTFGGRTANAQIHADLVTWLYANVRSDRLGELFPDNDVVLYGEGYGAGIQKGGLYSATKCFALFDVLLGGRWWLDWKNTCDVATKLDLDTVPFVRDMPLHEAVAFVRAGFDSQLGTACAEGLVGRTIEPLFDKRGNRLIVKLKTRDFGGQP